MVFQVITFFLIILFSFLIQWSQLRIPAINTELKNIHIKSLSYFEERINSSLSSTKFKRIHKNLLIDVSNQSHFQFRQLLFSITSYHNSTPSKMSLDQSTKLIQNWIKSKNSFYPEPNDKYFEILDSLRDCKIMKTDAVSKGSQLKLLLTFQGNIKAFYKPKRYQIDHVITGGPVAGFDRHNSEIVSFHISRLLGMRRAPFTTGRVLDFKNEVVNVATDRLKETTNSHSCFYGRCFYCHQKETVCADEQGKIEGAVILLLPKSYNITSRPNFFRKSLHDEKIQSWESSDNCKALFSLGIVSKKFWLDVVDVAIFDFLIQNADRHHFEMNDANEILLIDSGKGFGNPFKNEISILYPLIQCCIFRKSTLDRIVLLHNHGFKELLLIMLKRDQRESLLSQDHLKSLELRLKIIQVIMHDCRDRTS